MQLLDLQRLIENEEARLAVIGLGYVGLPVACEFAQAGFDTLGIDLQVEKVEMINAGVSPIEGSEPGLNDLLARVTGSDQLRATTDYSELRDRDVVLICVETPVDENYIPQYGALRVVLHDLAVVLKSGALVVVELTISPGTMNNLVKPLLEDASGKICNRDFYLGHCPERVMPGKLLANLRQVSRVVGGMTPETAETMLALYRHIVQADLDPADCVTAELVKTVENAYRDVQIAFANEVALICEQAGGNAWIVRDLVNKSPGRQMHLPGAGVGGHCIPKDPWLLVHAVQGTGLRLGLIPAARGVNDQMPKHIAEMLRRALEEAGPGLKGARILILGYAYLEESDDTRNSPSKILVDLLATCGVEVIIHDPYVSKYQGDILEKARGCDGVVVMVRHQVYFQLDLYALAEVLRTRVLVDGRSVISAEQARQAGMLYRIVGVDPRMQ